LLRSEESPLVRIFVLTLQNPLQDRAIHRLKDTLPGFYH